VPGWWYATVHLVKANIAARATTISNPLVLGEWKEERERFRSYFQKRDQLFWPLIRCQFHQCSTSSFCARRDPKSVRTQSSHQYLFTLLGSTSVKAVRRTLMKLSPGVNFINILRAAFAPVDPESIKRLSGSMSVKAVHRTLMKLSPDRFIDREQKGWWDEF
jgi:hypothetical protein